MDPTTLAGAAVGLLAPILGKLGDGGLTRLGESIADKSLEPLTRLYIQIRERLHGDTYGETVLERVEQRPDSVGRLRTLEDTLAELLTDDPQFAITLERLVNEAGATVSQQVNDSGAVAGGNVIIRGDYVAGRDLHIGDPPPEPAG